jgi:hypothetical protein
MQMVNPHAPRRWVYRGPNALSCRYPDRVLRSLDADIP